MNITEQNLILVSKYQIFRKTLNIKFNNSYELFCIANITNYSAFSNNNEKQTYSNYTSFTCVT